MSFPKKTTVFVIRAYKKYLSPFLPRMCRYYPTCSEYAAKAVDRHGFLRGTVMGVFRILRCNPFFEGGFDPVPQKFTLKWTQYGEEKRNEV
jgi:putative membrane protein insertion efficiency factor